MRNQTIVSSILAVGLVFMTCDAQADTYLKPVISSVKGKVTAISPGGVAAPVGAKQSVEIGTELRTGSASSALIAVVPGLSAEMKDRTTIRLKAAEVSGQGRTGEVELVQGSVVCSLKKQGALKQR